MKFVNLMGMKDFFEILVNASVKLRYSYSTVNETDLLFLYKFINFSDDETIEYYLEDCVLEIGYIVPGSKYNYCIDLRGVEDLADYLRSELDWLFGKIVKDYEGGGQDEN